MESEFLKKYSGQIAVTDKSGRASPLTTTQQRKAAQNGAGGTMKASAKPQGGMISSPKVSNNSGSDGGVIQVNRNLLDQLSSSPTTDYPIKSSNTGGITKYPQYPTPSASTPQASTPHASTPNSFYNSNTATPGSPYSNPYSNAPSTNSAPTIDNIRKLAAENKYRNYNNTPTATTPAANPSNLQSSSSPATNPYKAVFDHPTPSYAPIFPSTSSLDTNLLPNYGSPSSSNFAPHTFASPPSAYQYQSHQFQQYQQPTTNASIYSPQLQASQLRAQQQQQQQQSQYQPSQPQYQPSPSQYQPSQPQYTQHYQPQQFPSPQQQQYQIPPQQQQFSVPSAPLESSTKSNLSAHPSSPLSSSPSSTVPTLPNAVITEKEQLYYSKQPRSVYYKPHTLKDYRTLKEEIATLKLGTLGPDLQREEYVAQKEKKNRMKEYAEAVRTTHMVAGPPAGPRKVQQDTVQAQRQIAASQRQKAKEYADAVPRPRVRPKSIHIETPALQRLPSQSSVGAKRNSTDDLDVLRVMEDQHALAQQSVSQIRKELGLES